MKRRGHPDERDTRRSRTRTEFFGVRRGWEIVWGGVGPWVTGHTRETMVSMSPQRLASTSRFNRRSPGSSRAAPPGDRAPGLFGALLPWQRGVLEALWAVLVGLVPFVALAISGWLAGSAGAGSGWAAAAFGGDLWLFSHGVPLSVRGEEVGLVPWLLGLVPLGALMWSARRLVASLPEQTGRQRTRSGARGDVLHAAAGFVGAYVVVALVVAIVAATPAAGATLVAVPLWGALWPLLVYAWALARRFRGRLADVFPRLGWHWRVDVPLWTKRIVRPALWGTVVLFALGALAALTLVGFGLERVAVLTSYVDPGRAGGVLLVLAQLAYLPSFAAWAIGFAAGPGFAVGDNTLITWGAAEVGPLPLIPVFGALPEHGPLPAATAASALIPVVVGAWVGWRALRRVGTDLPPLGARTPGVDANTPPTAGRGLFVARLLVALSAALASAVVTAVACGLASGSLGGQRLAHVGVNPVAVGAALVLEMLAGAFVVVVLSMLRRARITRVEEHGEEDAFPG